MMTDVAGSPSLLGSFVEQPRRTAEQTDAQDKVCGGDCSSEPEDDVVSSHESASPAMVLWRRLHELVRFTLYRRQQHFNMVVNGQSSTVSPAPVVLSPSEPEALKEPNAAADETQTRKTKRSVKRVVCRLCLTDYAFNELVSLKLSCGHRFCESCLREMVKLAINEARTSIPCPLLDCSQHIHPSDIANILGPTNSATLAKYEQFMVRRVLQTIPDCRWCPSPDCQYAVIASGCASCPRLKCELCETEFCYHCQQMWHPDSTCNDASSGYWLGHPGRATNRGSAKRCPVGDPSGRSGRKKTHSTRRNRSRLWYQNNGATSARYAQLSQYNLACEKKLRETIKRCPCCKVAIMKVEDGSCNHMTCSQCGSEFCWLCLKVITDIHFLSPSGCTFWGRKRWSRRKKAIWQCLALLGAPIGISLAACISVPAIFVGLPVWAGRKTYRRLAFQSKKKRNIAVFLTSMSALLAAPLIASVTVVIGVPVLLTYTYAVIPMSMCRSDNRLDGYDDGSGNDELLIEEDEYYTEVESSLEGEEGTRRDELPLPSNAKPPAIGEQDGVCQGGASFKKVKLTGKYDKAQWSKRLRERKVQFASSLDAFSPIATTHTSRYSCFDACGTIAELVQQSPEPANSNSNQYGLPSPISFFFHPTLASGDPDQKGDGSLHLGHSKSASLCLSDHPSSSSSLNESERQWYSAHSLYGV